MLNELLKSVLSESATSAVYSQDIFASIDFGDTNANQGTWVSASVQSVCNQSASVQSVQTVLAQSKKPLGLVAIQDEEDQQWVRPENLERLILPLPYPSGMCSSADTYSSGALVTGTRPMAFGIKSQKPNA